MGGPEDLLLFVSAVKRGYSPGPGTAAVGFSRALPSRVALAQSHLRKSEHFYNFRLWILSFQDLPLLALPAVRSCLRGLDLLKSSLPNSSTSSFLRPLLTAETATVAVLTVQTLSEQTGLTDGRRLSC